MDSDYSTHENLHLRMFDYKEFKPQDIQNDFDPENNCFAKIQNYCEWAWETHNHKRCIIYYSVLTQISQKF